MSYPRCRLCSAELRHTFVDLGMSPPCESYLSASQLDAGETFYPLHVRVCENCLLVQLPAYISPEDVFSDYAYFSSYSDSWVAHARRFVDTAATRLGLGQRSFVIEVASNDGYLLQHTVAHGIRSLGIEPAANIAKVARDKGIDTEVMFLSEQTGDEVARRHGRADLVVANNVFAHVPDIVDFSRGLRALVADSGRVSIEIPHLLRLIEGNEYDTIYHEHYSYLTLLTAQRVLATADLEVVDIEELPTHGGSMRIWAAPAVASVEVAPSVARVLAEEAAAGLDTVEGHDGFSSQVATTRNDFVEFLINCQRSGKRVAGYGAPGKGNTLLNHCGIRSDLIEFTVDRNPHKHGLFLPGTHIPISPVERLAEERPDYVVIMPWNLREEITQQLSYVGEWGGRFVVSLPRLEVFEATSNSNAPRVDLSVTRAAALVT
jgi:C-methyltransferase C-terminal domain/Putative zinc binding domain/Methyltransferase domain